MGEERRIDPRFVFTMKAYPHGDETGRVFETGDVSAGGAYFVGDPGVEAGSTMWLHLELDTKIQGRKNLYPLDAEVVLVRMTRSPDGVIQGFGARWLSVLCAGDLAPLQQFLKAVLSVSAGFVEAHRAQDNGDDVTYEFIFPRDGSAREEVARPATRPPNVARPDAAISDGGRTGIYVMIPVSVVTEDGEFEARAVKLLDHGMRLAAMDTPPEAYRRVTIKIPIKKDKDKSSILALAGTVKAVRKGAGDNQFEVELSLGNDPEALASYRRILDQLSQSLQSAR